MDSEYEALMAELGTGKPKGPLGQDPQKSRTENLASQPAQNINRVKLSPSGKPGSIMIILA